VSLERAWAYQELHSASAAVFHGACQLQCLLAHRLAGLLVQEDGRCLLEHLLVAALDAALTLVEVDAVAVPIEKHLASKQAGTINCERIRGGGCESETRGDVHPGAAAGGGVCNRQGWWLTWISMWRGRSTNRSIRMRSSPKLDRACTARTNVKQSQLSQQFRGQGRVSGWGGGG
jgi:hypothetical protein